MCGLEKEVLSNVRGCGQEWSGEGLPGGLVVKNPPAHAGDTGLAPDPERPHIATKPVRHIY